MGAVLIVAAVAAIVSAVHIYSLAIRYGQPRAVAGMMPVSIDGTVMGASFSLYRAGLLSLPGRNLLGQSMLILGVLATLGANLDYGISQGWVGAAISAWPAVAFVGSAELAITMARRVAEHARSKPQPVPARSRRRWLARLARTGPARKPVPAAAYQPPAAVPVPGPVNVPAGPAVPVPARSEPPVPAAVPRSRTAARTTVPADRDAAAEAYRLSGGTLSERKLADLHCGRSRRMAQSIIAEYRQAAVRASEPVPAGMQ
jgi:hypothetical protein